MIHGRETEYSTLQKWVEEGGPVALIGGSAMGKTDLVRAIVRARSGIYCDLHAARHEGEALSLLGESLGVLQENYVDPSVRGEAIREALAHHEGLVVIDHATRVADALMKHVDPASWASIIVVSRRPISGIEKALELGPLDIESALEFAQEWAPRDLHAATLEAALKASGLAPGAVHWVAASGAIDRETANSLRESEHEPTVAAAQWVWNTLSDEDRADLARLATLTGGFDERLAGALGVTNLARWEDRGWLERTSDECWRVHAIVSEELAEDISTHQAAAARAVIEHVDEATREVPPAIRQNLAWLGPVVADEDPGLAWQCLSRRIDMLADRGRHVAVLEGLDEAEGWPLGGADRAQLHLARGRVLATSFSLDREAAHDFSVARTLSRSSSDQVGLLESEILLAATMGRLGRGDSEPLEKALETALSRDERRLEALAMRHLADFEGPGESRIDLLYQSARRFREAGAHRESSEAYHAAAMAHFDVGRDGEALSILTRAEDQAQRSRSSEARRRVAWSTALAHAEQGDIQVGLSLSEEIEDAKATGAISRDREGRRVRALMLASLARDEEANGELEVLVDIAQHRKEHDALAEALLGYTALVSADWPRLRGALTRSQTGSDATTRQAVTTKILGAMLAAACSEKKMLADMLRDASVIKQWGEGWAEIHDRLSEVTESLGWMRPGDLDPDSTAPAPTPRNLIDALLSRVENALEDVISGGALLSIAHDGTSFRVGRENVDVRRRRALPEILVALAERHPSDEPFDVYEIFDIGWPGEEIGAEQAAARVYNAIRTLRNLGLEDFLVTSSDGYMLDPTLDLGRHD